MNETILVIDIGNSMTTLGLSRRGGHGVAARTLNVATNAVTARAAEAAVARLIASRCPVVAVGASVVPKVDGLWARAIRRAAGIRLQWIRHDMPWNFCWRYAAPGTLGADRIVNLHAARRRYPPPLVVLDFGTALTVDMLNEANEFAGGMIAPGFPMLAGAMSGRTALLPELQPRIGRMPPDVFGRNSREAMRRGILYGYRGLVRELITTAVTALGAGTAVCATGGYAAAALATLPEFRCRIHPKLTLEGLAHAGRLLTASGQREKGLP